eukprot:s1858_g15.t1
MWDISRAHFYGIPKRTIYIELPDEDASYTESGEKECGLLKKSMYGTPDAPNIWQQHYTTLLESADIKRGRSNASVFYRERDGTRVVVHGDDFLVLSDSQGLEEIDNLLRSKYELKRLGTLGFEEGDDREIHFLNRLIRVGKHNGRQAVFLEPDRRHVDLLIRELGLETAKGVDTPDVKKSGTSPEPTDPPPPPSTTEGQDEGDADAACHSGMALGLLMALVGGFSFCWKHSNVVIPRNLLHVENTLDIPLFNAALSRGLNTFIRLCQPSWKILQRFGGQGERTESAGTHAFPMHYDRVEIAGCWFCQLSFQISGTISPPSCFNFHRSFLRENFHQRPAEKSPTRVVEGRSTLHYEGFLAAGKILRALAASTSAAQFARGDMRHLCPDAKAVFRTLRENRLLGGSSHLETGQ